jgi:biopolymer transport protein ExbB/TolQ
MSSRLLALASRAPTIGLVAYGLLAPFGRLASAQPAPGGPSGSAAPAIPAVPPAVQAPAGLGTTPPAPEVGAPPPPAAPPPSQAATPIQQTPAPPAPGAAPATDAPVAAPSGATAPGAPASPAPVAAPTADPATAGAAPMADPVAPGAVPAADPAAPTMDPSAPGAVAPPAEALLPAVPPPGTGSSAEALAHAADHSILGLITQAGPVVQGVMGALVLASIVCWAIMFEKAILLRRLRREVSLLSNTGDPAAATGEGLAARMQRAAAREWAEGRDHDESRGAYRERIERAMRETLSSTMRSAQSGTAFLATTGAVGPFVGLFGTVWGIMGSFQGIAQMQDTSLAVVAPGIAEALLATAIGLFAAIPAVIGYNRIARRVAGLRAEALAAIAATGARLSGRPPRGGNLARAAE